MVERLVTTASFFLVGFCPLPSRTGGVTGACGTIGTPLPSACTTRMAPSVGLGLGSTDCV
jgi:hypothetical protein